MANKKDKEPLSEDEKRKQELAHTIWDFYESTVRLRLKEAGEQAPESMIPDLTRYLIEQDKQKGINPVERMFGRVPDAVKLDDKGRRILELHGDKVIEKHMICLKKVRRKIDPI